MEVNMKILFIDGHFTHDGWLCIRRDGVTKRGEFRVRYRMHTTIQNHKTIKKLKPTSKTILVVRQRCKWDTFRILCHELMHWLFEFLPDKLGSKLDKWLDRE